MKSPHPRLYGLFQKRIDGDDALLELARLRFQEAALGPEFYASSPEELQWLLRFNPRSSAPAVVHLPRKINLLNPIDRSRIIHFAAAFPGEVERFVVHDQLETKSRFADYRAALLELDTALQALPNRAFLFVEYAVGLEPAYYCDIHARLHDLQYVSACIDIGHFGIYFARQNFCHIHPGQDVCSIHPSDPQLPELVEDIQHAVSLVLPMVLAVIRQLASLGKPLHFHLHDGHPLSTFSDFGVSDHLSFFETIPLPFSFKGKSELVTMFSPAGLEKIVKESMTLLEPDHLTFSLEIHPSPGRRMPLRGNACHLFDHWRLKINAEKMNYWLYVLLQNHSLLSNIVRKNMQYA